MFPLSFMSLFAVLSVVVFARPNANSIVEMGEGEPVPDPRVINYNTMYKAAVKFPCKPQPRAFLAKDLRTDAQDASYSFKPNNVVLHRCDRESGCCLKDNEYCGERTAEQIIIQLRAESRFTSEVKIIEITATNHTSCECASDSPPKRENYTNDARVEPLTSAGLTNNPNEYKLLLCVASLLYFIYLSY